MQCFWTCALFVFLMQFTRFCINLQKSELKLCTSLIFTLTCRGHANSTDHIGVVVQQRYGGHLYPAVAHKCGCLLDDWSVQCVPNGPIIREKDEEDIIKRGKWETEYQPRLMSKRVKAPGQRVHLGTKSRREGEAPAGGDNDERRMQKGFRRSPSSHKFLTRITVIASGSTSLKCSPKPNAADSVDHCWLDHFMNTYFHCFSGDPVSPAGLLPDNKIIHSS